MALGYSSPSEKMQKKGRNRVLQRRLRWEGSSGPNAAGGSVVPSRKTSLDKTVEFSALHFLMLPVKAVLVVMVKAKAQPQGGEKSKEKKGVGRGSRFLGSFRIIETGNKSIAYREFF